MTPSLKQHSKRGFTLSRIPGTLKYQNNLVKWNQVYWSIYGPTCSSFNSLSDTVLSALRVFLHELSCHGFPSEDINCSHLLFRFSMYEKRKARHISSQNGSSILIDSSHRYFHGDLGPWTPSFLFLKKWQLQLCYLSWSSAAHRYLYHLSVIIILGVHGSYDFSAIGCYQLA